MSNNNFEENLKSAYTEVTNLSDMNGSNEEKKMQLKMEKFYELRELINENLSARMQSNNFTSLLNSTMVVCKSKCLRSVSELSSDEKKCLETCAFKVRKMVNLISDAQRKGVLNNLALVLSDREELEVLKEIRRERE